MSGGIGGKEPRKIIESGLLFGGANKNKGRKKRIRYPETALGTTFFYRKGGTSPKKRVGKFHKMYRWVYRGPVESDEGVSGTGGNGTKWGPTACKDSCKTALAEASGRRVVGETKRKPGQSSDKASSQLKLHLNKDNKKTNVRRKRSLGCKWPTTPNGFRQTNREVLKNQGGKRQLGEKIRGRGKPKKRGI